MWLSLLTALALSQSPAYTTARGVPVPLPTQGRADTINLVSWTGNPLPRIYERSDQLPLTDDEVEKLTKAGFTPAQLVKMIEERRCACDASADGMIRMKQAGVSEEVISAISLHALPPNRALALDITLDFVGEGNQAKDNFLYFFLDDGSHYRVLSANVAELLSRRNDHESSIDQSDLLIPRVTRRIEIPGELALKQYGKHSLIVVASPNPTLTGPDQLTPMERQRAQTFTFDYPRSSLQSLCRLTAAFRRDPVLAYKWNYAGARFECEWN
jgi:hypothetical protein